MGIASTGKRALAAAAGLAAISLVAACSENAPHQDRRADETATAASTDPTGLDAKGNGCPKGQHVSEFAGCQPDGIEKLENSCTPPKNAPARGNKFPTFTNHASPVVANLAVATNYNGLRAAIAPDQTLGQNVIGCNTIFAGLQNDIYGHPVPNAKNLTSTGLDLFLAHQICAAVGGHVAHLRDLAYQDSSLLGDVAISPAGSGFTIALFEDAPNTPRLYNFANGQITAVTAAVQKGSNCKAVAGSFGGCFNDPPTIPFAVVCAPGK